MDREELANVVTHGVGFLLAAVATLLGVFLASETGGALRITTVAIFGATLCCLYAASTGYHVVGLIDPAHRRRALWKRLDHAAIYLLIAGTYTPVMLVLLPPAWGWSIAGSVWGCAAVGLTLKLARPSVGGRVSTLLYVLTGWIGVIGIVPLYHALPPSGLAWLFAGGLCYTLGCPFYLWGRLPYNHALWHLFVLAGSACHVALVLGHVAA